MARVRPVSTGAPMTEDQATMEALAAGERLFARPWHFVLGAPRLDVLPPADRPEIAFAGRSNVGKSSLINALVGQRGLARTSRTPGRTQELNLFEPPDADLYLVDLPGYGFARAPKGKVDAWTRLVKNYLQGRPTLKRVYLLVDARRGLKPSDRQIMDLLDAAAVSYEIVLTKVDKVATTELDAALAAVRREIRTRPAAYPAVRTTTALKGQGIESLRAGIAGLVATVPPP